MKGCGMKKFSRGFTLIELLVVITIIVVLIGILLPSLGRARLQARKSAVLAQLHGIGVAMASYENEYNYARPTDLTDTNQDGRAFGGLALLAHLYKMPPKLFVNPNTSDTPSTLVDPNGWPVLATVGGVAISATAPATIDGSNMGDVKFHCSFAYDHERKRSGSVQQMRVYLGDRGDYSGGRSFSANWGKPGTAGSGMAVLFSDQHAEFVKSKALADQADPNMYHHNEFGGEGSSEVVDGVSVTPATLDTHLRFFSEEEDDALLPND
jgi:prepilin-type N-terminal cleavage/methylation domain-containing protein